MSNHAKYRLSFLTIIIFAMMLVGCSNGDSEIDSSNDVSTNEEVSANVEEDKDEKEKSEGKNEDLAIYSDNINTSPTIRDIVDVFAKLQLSYSNQEEIDENDNSNFTYEWLGEEELDGETVDKIKIHILIDSEFENYEEYADLWVDKEGTVVQLINEHDTVYTIGGEDDVEYAEMMYTMRILFPFTFVDEHVRPYLNPSLSTLTDHETGTEQLFGETVETHTIKAIGADDFHIDHSESTFAYFNGLEVALSSVIEGEFPDYFNLNIIDFEVK